MRPIPVWKCPNCNNVNVWHAMHFEGKIAVAASAMQTCGACDRRWTPFQLQKLTWALLDEVV